jgi:hypothetical protein
MGNGAVGEAAGLAALIMNFQDVGWLGTGHARWRVTGISGCGGFYHRTCAQRQAAMILDTFAIARGAFAVVAIY